MKHEPEHKLLLGKGQSFFVKSQLRLLDFGGSIEFASARKAKLSRFVHAHVKKFHYTYDMGDNWKHISQIEKVLTADPRAKYPRCVKGSRAGHRRTAAL
jgi:hypothetical protein